MSIASVAVFCGSKFGNNSIYKKDAIALGTLLAQKGIAVIYGGGKNGLMGAVADGALEAGGAVRGIITKQLGDWEVGHPALNELIVVESMHERKRLMYERCNCAVILPGGFGTLDELFELLTWNQLSLHDKPVFLLNTNGFFTYLLQHLEHAAREGFLYGNLSEQYTVLQTPQEILTFL